MHTDLFLRGSCTTNLPKISIVTFLLPFHAIQGMISEAELPIHFRRTLALDDVSESYEQMLTNTLGFDNPNNVAYLTKLLQLDEKKPPSLMRGLQRFVHHS